MQPFPSGEGGRQARQGTTPHQITRIRILLSTWKLSLVEANVLVEMGRVTEDWTVPPMGVRAGPIVESINMGNSGSVGGVDTRVFPRKSLGGGVSSGRGSWMRSNPWTTDGTCVSLNGVGAGSSSGDKMGSGEGSPRRPKGGAGLRKNSEAGIAPGPGPRPGLALRLELGPGPGLMLQLGSGPSSRFGWQWGPGWESGS